MRFATYLLLLTALVVFVIGCFGCDEKKKEKSQIEIWENQRQTYREAAIAFDDKAFENWNISRPEMNDTLHKMAECLRKSADSVWMLIQMEKVKGCDCLKQQVVVNTDGKHYNKRFNGMVNGDTLFLKGDTIIVN